MASLSARGDRATGRPRAQPRTRRRALAALTFLGCAAVTLALMHRAIVPLDGLPLLGKDPAQMVWNLWIVEHLVLGGHSPFWTDLVFHPAGVNLAHHSLSAGFLPVTLLVRAVTGADPLHPLYAYRILLGLGYALNLFLSLRLLRRLGFGPAIAFAGALAAAFCTFQREHIYPLNHRATFFFPLFGLAVLRLAEHPSRGRAAGVAAVLGIFLYFSHFAVFLGMATVVFVACLAATRAGREGLRSLYRSLPAGSIPLAAGVFLAIVSPFAIAWSRDAIQPWPRSSLSFFSTNLAGLVVSGPTTPLYAPLWHGLWDRPWQGQTGELVFLGYPLILGVILGLRGWAGRRGDARTRGHAEEPIPLTGSFGRAARRAAGWTGGAFLVLSLGPTLKVLGTDTGLSLPYGWIADLPPLAANRAPYRFLAVAVFFLVFVAAAGWRSLQDRLDARGSRGLARALPLLLVAWVAAEAARPLPAPIRVRVPEALRDPPPGPYLNLPLSQVDGFAALLQIFHHQPILTGYTARHGPAQRAQFDRLVAALREGPKAFHDELERLGARAIVLSPRASPGDVLAASQSGLEVIDLRPPPRTLPGLPLDPLPAGTPPDSPLARPLEEGRVLTFTAAQPLEAREVEVSADRDDAYRLEMLAGGRDGRLLGAVRIPAARRTRLPGIAWRVIALPPDLQGVPFDTIRLTVTRRRGRAAIGHVHFR